MMEERIKRAEMAMIEAEKVFKQWDESYERVKAERGKPDHLYTVMGRRSQSMQRYFGAKARYAAMITG